MMQRRGLKVRSVRETKCKRDKAKRLAGIYKVLLAGGEGRSKTLWSCDYHIGSSQRRAGRDKEWWHG